MKQLIRGHSSLWRSLAGDFGEIRGHLTIHLLNHWISVGFHSTIGCLISEFHFSQLGMIRSGAAARSRHIAPKWPGLIKPSLRVWFSYKLPTEKVISGYVICRKSGLSAES